MIDNQVEALDVDADEIAVAEPGAVESDTVESEPVETVAPEVGNAESDLAAPEIVEDQIVDRVPGRHRSPPASGSLRERVQPMRPVVAAAAAVATVLALVGSVVGVIVIPDQPADVRQLPPSLVADGYSEVSPDGASLPGATPVPVGTAPPVGPSTGSVKPAPGAPLRPAPPPPPPPPPTFFVDPDSPAARQQKTWSEQGRGDDARKIGTLARQPLAEWVTSGRGKAGPEVDAYVDRAAAAGRQPLLVAYFIPNRDCGSHSGGGAKDAGDYRSWIREFASGLGGRAATVILEPDALPHAVQGCSGSSDERYRSLADAVDVLKASGPVTVYIDAGNPIFMPDVGAMSDALRRSGIARADGFSLNVANFFPTADVVRHGKALSGALGGAHFVVDTSRNGNGKIEGGDVNGGPAWCNPPGRKVGPAPTRDTGDPAVDAYLWIKRVGESDGSCRSGEPSAGTWWADYALGLVP